MTADPDGGLSPVGRHHEIGEGAQRAVVTESGATLRAYDVGGRPVLEAFDGPESLVVGGQGEILAPWPNRVVDGTWAWRSTTHQLWLTEPSRGHAIHGLVRKLRWTPTRLEAARVDLATTLLAHPGWPFPLHLEASYALGPDGLTARLRATNVGRTPCPFGAGAHPYLAVPGGGADDAVVSVPAATWLAIDERMVPAGRRATAGSAHELDGTAPLGTRQADTPFTDLERRPDGRVEARLTAPDGRTTVVWGDASVRWWQLYTADALPGRWRRAAVALEPMTCGPNALNTGEDLILLEPGDAFTMTWGLTLQPGDGRT